MRMARSHLKQEAIGETVEGTNIHARELPEFAAEHLESATLVPSPP